MIERITILGGSSVYIPEFITSLTSNNVNVKEIVLYGRPGEKLETVAGFCQRLVKKRGFPMSIVPSTNLEEAVTGAKYVLNHVRIGGMKARLRNEKVPAENGMIGDESLGAGGLANALRTLPTVLEFAQRIETVNPDCTFINLTNPMSIIVEALLKHTNLNVIGVCDLPGTYTKKVAAILERPVSELDVNYIGLNHMGWIQDVRVDDRSCLSEVLEKIATDSQDGFDHDLIRLFRMIPTRAISLYFHSDRVLAEQQKMARYRSEVLHEAEQQILELYRDTHLNDIPELTHSRNTCWYEETIVPLIQGLETGDGRTLVLCVRNEGAIRDLPDDCSVEVPVTLSSEGLEPRKVGNCPHFLKGLFTAVKESDRRIVEAVHHKSYGLALQALTINPFVPSLDTAQTFLDSIVKSEELELR